MLELQDEQERRGRASWIDLSRMLDLGLFEERQPDSPGPTQTHDHYSGNLYFQTRGGSLDWTR